uniref:Uncharacterized protein n=1 Tax=Avena sativa TaxID=4498 RepID=A0ACD5V5C0_AVESA
MLLGLQAYLPSLHPLDCEINKEPNNCEAAQGWNLTLLFLCLLLFAVGEGCMLACIPFLGGDQFSNDETNETQLKVTFLSWLKFANSLGALMGLIFLVWIENNLGWTIGFIISAVIVLLGLFVAASGLPFYITKKPNRSPLRRILQVLVPLSKKRQAATVDVIDLQEIGRAECVDAEGKSDIEITGSTRDEELTKVIIRMLPIFISCLLIYLPFTLLRTLTIQVGSTMDRGIGTIQISSASLITIPTTIHMFMAPCYRQILTPCLSLRRFTGHTHGITPLQRIGAGSVCGIAAACLATLVETRRLTIAEQHGLTSTAVGVPMSVFWLVMQFFLLSIADAACFSGLIEFIKSESSPEMKLLAPDMQSIIAGIAALLACAFLHLVNRATRHGDSGRGWLDGTNFNMTRLDRFFLVLTAFELVALINYAFWARRYANRKRSSADGLAGNRSGN